MSHLSVSPNNHFCPQALFLFGTNKEDGAPNFGLFCWVSYYCDPEELKVIATLNGSKVTRDRIRAEGRFSANLVSQPLLPLADYLGCTDGYDPHKMDIPVNLARGAVLDVPILADSPFIMELEVEHSLIHSDSETFFCRIRNVLIEESLLDAEKSADERIAAAAPVVVFGLQRYAALAPHLLGAWGDWSDLRNQ